MITHLVSALPEHHRREKKSLCDKSSELHSLSIAGSQNPEFPLLLPIPSFHTSLLLLSQKTPSE